MSAVARVVVADWLAAITLSRQIARPLAMTSSGMERTLLVKPEVFVYRIPPRASARGYRAADWNLAQPDWTCRLRVVDKDNSCEIRLEDRNDGSLFGACPVDQYPGTTVESVTDSSRYFVVCLQNAGQKAYVGMGFSDRSDSFDLNVALQDHFKGVRRDSEFADQNLQQKNEPKLDLAFKEGQTIRINIPKKKENEDSEALNIKPSRASGSKSMGLALPPPPSGSNRPNPQSVMLDNNNALSTATKSSSNDVDLLGLDSPLATASKSTTTDAFGSDPWGDFASAAPPNHSGGSNNWEQF